MLSLKPLKPQAACQALDFEFTVISASDVKGCYRDFCVLNYPTRFIHFHSSIEAQCEESKPCELCLEAGEEHMALRPCKVQSEIAPGDSVDMMFSGSPCDPFSCQRAKRFNDGVVCHSQFDITMSKVIDMYLRHEPKVGVFEQVMGFTMPFIKGGVETPKSRRAGCILPGANNNSQ